MAGNGRRAKGLASSTPVLRAPEGPLGPELPDGPSVLPRGREWKPIVVKWYEDFRRSPQASLVRSDAMWMAVQVGFVELDEMLTTGRFGSLGPEVRQLFSQFGWSPASLRAMKFDIPDADDHAAGVGSADGLDGVSVDFEEYRRRRRAVGFGS